MSRIRKALVLATAERYFGVVVNFPVIVIVSRLLTPREIGLWVIGAAILMVASAVRELASYNYLIQCRELTREDIRSAFTVMAVVTIAIAGLLYALAPWAAAAYQEDSLLLYLRIMAVSLLFDLVAAPILALLRREMSFGKVAVINMANATINAGAIIALAVFGFSYMSFAWGWLLASAGTGVLALCLRPDLWVFWPSLNDWRGPLTFGRYYGTNMILYRANESFLYLLLGRILSFDAVGLYNRAVMVSQLPDKFLFGGVGSLVVPAFSAEVREGRSVKVLYLRAIEYITAVQWPALILLAILAQPTVEVVLGQQWAETVPIIQILAVASLFSFTANLDYAVLISVGGIRDNFQRALIVVPVSALVLICASFFGLMAMALSQLLVIPLEAYVSLRFLRRHVPIGWQELAGALRKSAVVAACTAICPSVAVLAEPDFDFSIGTALGVVALSAISWAVGLWVSQHPILDEITHTASTPLAKSSVL